MTTKQCRKCKAVKEVTTDFYPHNKNSRDNFDSMCKECWKLRSRERSRGSGGEAVKKLAVRLADQGRGWKAVSGDVSASEAFTVRVTAAQKGHVRERPPSGVTTQYPARLADIPGDGVQYHLFEGTNLVSAVAEFRATSDYSGPLTVYVFVRSTGVPLYYVRVPTKITPTEGVQHVRKSSKARHEGRAGHPHHDRRSAEH